jgi:outer membrane biosynthesis protein TonB
MINEKKNRLKGIIGTILFHLGILLILLLMALRTPLPLPGEEGVLVNLGYDETGMGVDQQELPATPEPKPKLAPQQLKTEDEDYLVQDVEEAPALKEKKPVKKKKEPEKEIQKPKPEPVKEVVAPEPQPEPQPKADPKAMYKGKGTAKQGGQEGQTGQPGDQGDPSGVPGAGIYKGKSGDGNGTGEGIGTGTGIGSGDGSGNGIHYELGERGSLNLHKPSYDSKEQGTVVVTIKVDKKGNVTSANPGVKGSNTTNDTLWKLAKDAALRSKFEADPDAPEVQIGTITYVFIRQN